MIVYAILFQNSRGDLHISLSYYPKESVLKGVILKATNLKKDTISELAGSSRISVFL